MNIENLSSQLKFPNRIGQTLSVEERINLEVGVSRLKKQYDYQNLNWWGRIEGIVKNYYIVEGFSFKTPGFPVKKFFWSSEDFQFAELPSPRLQFKDQVLHLDSFFTGQPEKIIFRLQTQQNKLINYQGQQLAVKTKNFTQLDRLAIIVSSVEQDCQVVPLGAYRMIPTHQLIKNPDFRGLKIQNSKKIQSYVHLRSPKLEEKKVLIECDKSLERIDFLDPISQDPIKKSWSLQCDESGTEITIRSLLWPGYVAYHRTNSTIFGGVYMGSGIKSCDLSFIL